MLNKDVAIKILHHVNELSVQRFQREAQAAYNLHHENVVAVHEFGVTDEGQPYMVMEYIEGKTLSTVIDERGALPLDLCINVFRQVCSGVLHAHSRGVVHRDLKPSNIMLTNPESWSPEVRIVDFGIAKVLDFEDSGSDTGKLTRTGDFVGSPQYMSPEQCLGKTVDLRSDIYSIGCIMFEALTGRAPFNGGTSMEVMLKQMNDKPPSLKESCGKTFPVWIERLVARCLAKDPEQRFQTVDDMLKSIEDRVVASANATAKGEKKHSANSILLPVSVALALLVVAGGVTFFFLSEPHPKTTTKMPSEELSEKLPLFKTQPEKGASASSEEPDVIIAPTQDEIIRSDIADRSRKEIVSSNRRINDSALLSLKDRIDIDSISITNAGISDKAFAHIRQLPLRKLDLSFNLLVTGKVLDNVNPDFLEFLDLSHTGFKSRDLALLGRFKNLRTLKLNQDGIDDSDLPQLLKLKNLDSLELSENLEIYDSSCSIMARLPRLRQIKLNNTRITGKGLTALSQLKNLFALSVIGTKVDDSGVQALEGLPIARLQLQHTAITDGAVKSLAKMKTLLELGFERIKLSPQSMRSIATLPKLFKLMLFQCDVTDQDLEVLAHCQTIRELYLSGNLAITSAGLKSLSRLPLQELIMVKTSITDQDLPALYDWKNLRTLDVSRCAVTQAGAERLKSAVGAGLSVYPFDEPIIKNINFGSPF